MSRKHKIVYLITGLSTGGAEMMLLRLLKDLDKSLFQPHVVALIDTDSSIKDKFTNAGIPVSIIGMKLKIDIRLFKLISMLRKMNPDILHTQLFAADIIGRILGRIAGVPIIVTSVRNRYYGGEIRNLVIRMTGKFADKITFVSNDAAKHFIKKKLIRAEKAEVLYSGLDPKEFSRAGSREIKLALRKKLNLPVDGVQLLCVGSLTKQKGYPDLFKAYKIIFEKYPDSNLVIAGTGPLEADLKRMIVNLGLHEHVTMLGLYKNIAGLMSAADIFVLSSHWEGLPGAVLEAMASELPVIATESGGTSELVEDGVTGFLVPVGNPEMMAESLDRLIRMQHEERLKMGRAGRKRVENNFHIKRMVSDYENMYKECLQKAGLE